MVRRSARIKNNAAPVKGNWDILPHGMGALPKSTSQPVTEAIPDVQSPEPKGPSGDDSDEVVHQPELEEVEAEIQVMSTIVSSPIPQPQSDKDSMSESEDKGKYPTDTVAPQEPEEEAQRLQEEMVPVEQVTVLRRSKRIHAQAKIGNSEDVGEDVPLKRAKHVHKTVKIAEDAVEVDELSKKPKRVPRKTKDNPYGLTPGRSPFPEWHAPSAAQCEEVYRILANTHGEVTQPATIPAPSLEIAGCGEVPFVLEALLRTLLSGAVTFDGADSMVKGIIAKYGIIEDELAKGSIDWNKVRLSTIEELEDAIRIGGLASRKAKAIKGTLDMVYQENFDRREAYMAEKATGVPATVYGASEKTEGQKDLEILKTERNILSLDHLHGLSADEAMRQFTKFPGIGVKTAACVILFCLQRPCFAVDTHVHRFSRWLGWAPAKADENDTFSHLEVRCPDHLKYGLHQLFIHHGKHCTRCKMSTVEGTKEWEAVVCPLEHLLVRAKKMTKVQKKPKANNAKSGTPEDEEKEAEAEHELEHLEAEEPSSEVEEPTLEIEEPTLEVEEPTLEVEEPTLEVEEPTLEVEEPALEIEEPALDEEDEI
ncbi:putative amidophosphoribosyltransferase [Rosellinia necatrix]|uniref:Putative amidophosphoribosyltransferase n=1 Tax=Rosellinia necatrix TaxID=77044 RepID=A0A1W2TGD7_ROSNE|nr:putative amidophosphoribosyltransferase [Rosellinia necatrix]